MRWFWTVDDGVRPPSDVVVDADPDTAVSALAQALGLEVGLLAPGAWPDTPLSEVALDSGMALPQRRSAPRPEHAVRLRGGPLGGLAVATGWPAGARPLTIGRDPGCDIVIPDPTLSRVAAVLHPATQGRARLVRPAGAGPVLVNGSAVQPEAGPGELTAGAAASGRAHGSDELLAADDVVEVGSSVLGVGTVDLPRADVVRGRGGELELTRAARVQPARRVHRLTLPGPRPQEPSANPVAWAMATLPAVLGGAGAWATHTPIMLAAGLFSPLLVAASYRWTWTFGRRRAASATATWHAARVVLSRRLGEAEDAQRRHAWLISPDPASVVEECLVRGARLWERRLGDDDALTVRLGLAERPVAVEFIGLPDPDDRTAMMSPVPIALDLRAAGVLGVAGPPEVTQGLARWIVLQLAAQRSPRDLLLCVLCEPDAEAAWRWTSWLPHLRPNEPGGPAVLIGNTDATRAARVGELARLVERRRQAPDRRTARRTEAVPRFSPDIVVLIDAGHRHRCVPGMSTLLNDGPGVGVYAVCLDDDRARLPPEAQAHLLAVGPDPGMGALESAVGGCPRLLLDGTSADVAEQAARALAPLTHAGGDGDPRQLPSDVRLLDLLADGRGVEGREPGLDLTDPGWVLDRWKLGGRSTRITVGADADTPVTVDLRADGPHALVAGAPGAGTNEFLASIVLSLAVANRPDALAFVLIGPEATPAFAQLARLPHTVAVTPGLDHPEAARVLAGLEAELRQRRRALRALACGDVDDAWQRDPRAAAAAGLPRLVLVVDDVADVAGAVPELVNGLLRIAQDDGALGIHVVLATQRPAGTVSADLLKNLGLRVAMRMPDRDTSVEVLGTPVAAAISPRTPGRGCLRRASGAPPVAFQTARLAGRTTPGGGGTGTGGTSSPRLRVHPVGWSELGEPVPVSPGGGCGSASGAGDGGSDLRALVALLNRAAQQLGLQRGPGPWHPPLPTMLTTAQLRAKAADGAGAPDSAGRGQGCGKGLLLGLLDRPEEQDQVPVRYRLGDGHLALVGSPGSGVSSVLRTLLSEVARCTSPDDVQLYVVDFGGSALEPVADLPHCAAFIRGHENGERAVRLLKQVADEVTARRNAGAERAPNHLLLVVDGWERFVGAFPQDECQALRERFDGLLRHGPSVGVAVVITGDRALLSDRSAGAISNRWILRLTDRRDYLLAGLDPGRLPVHVPDGRAYAATAVHGVQFALISKDPSATGQAAALTEAVRQARRVARGAQVCVPGVDP